jgi:hypothetical protein
MDNSSLANHQSDSIAFRYWKHRENVSKFLPLQLGICGFKYDTNQAKLECFPFNIYILPHSKSTNKILQA